MKLALSALVFAVAFIMTPDRSHADGLQGHYQGTIIHVIGGTSISFPVQAEVSAPKKDQAVIVLTKLDGSPYSKVQFDHISSKSINVQIEEIGNKGGKLKKDEDNCFTGSDSYQLHVCLYREEILVDVSDTSGNSVYSLSLDQFAGEQPLKLETPKTYSLDEAVSTAFKMEFNTRLEFQHAEQARHQAKQAALNLLPHLTVGTVLNIASTPTLLGLFSAVGDIAPFLLPSRWLKKKGMALASEAEQDSLILMRGEVGIQVEGFAYLLERDEKILALYTATIKQSQEVCEQVRTLEALGKFHVGTADNMQTVINSMKNDALALSTTLKQEKALAAQSLGLMNPEAILKIETPKNVPSIDEASAKTEAELNAEVLGRSFELRQMDFLIKSADAMKKAMYFNWIDPSADSTTGLGFAFGETIAIEKSKVSELKIKRQQVQQILLQRIQLSVNEYNTTLQSYSMAKQDAAIQERRLSRTLELLKFGKDVSILDLVTVFQDRLRSSVNQLNAVASFKVTRAKLERLTLQGYYSRLSGGRAVSN